MKNLKRAISLIICLVMLLGSTAFCFNSMFAVKASAGGLSNGATIKFGRFEKDGIESNGYESLYWTLVDVDTGLCICQTVIDARAFDEDGSGNYEESSIRAWLYGEDGDGEFYTDAFTETEKTAIIESPVVTYEYGSDTEEASTIYDGVFLPSVQEVEKYLTNVDDRLMYPTRYARNREIQQYEKEYCWWWLRSPGSTSRNALDVLPTGEINANGDSARNSFIGIRPALHINLKSEITLVANNGTDETEKITVDAFSTNVKPECNFTNGDLYFCFWYKDAACTELWTSKDVAVGDMTLYACWTKFPVGATVTVGRFEQDGDISNGSEEIEWIVVDPVSGLCISKYILDNRKFGDNTNYYHSSEVRKWLCGEDGSGDFYSLSFSDEEKALFKSEEINTYIYKTQKEIRSTVHDKVFLISAEEFKSDYMRNEFKSASATPYAASRGNYGSWLTRSESEGRNYHVYTVESNGNLSDYGVTDGGISGVRPAAYFDLSSDFFSVEEEHPDISIGGTIGDNDPQPETPSIFDRIINFFKKLFENISVVFVFVVIKLG